MFKDYRAGLELVDDTGGILKMTRYLEMIQSPRLGDIHKTLWITFKALMQGEKIGQHVYRVVLSDGKRFDGMFFFSAF